MTIEVLEHNGIYTAYRRTIKRGSDGKLFESATRIDFPFPPAKSSELPSWATSLSPDQLDVGMQIFFDRWNFSNGNSRELEIYQCLYEVKQKRRSSSSGDQNVGTHNVMLGRNTKGQLTISGQLKFPVIKK